MNKITEWDAGDVVVFVEASDAQVNYGGVDDPREVLRLRHQYKLDSVAVGGWKSYVTLSGIEGTFNSVHFDNLTKEDYGHRPSLEVKSDSKIDETDEDYDCTSDTLNHIQRVYELLGEAAMDLHERGIHHDKSKLSEHEKPLFNKFTPKLKDCTYGSDLYQKYLDELAPALNHHYTENSHHPEHTFTREEWKDVVGYEDVYQVSSIGRVRRKEQLVERKRQGSYVKSGQEMTPHVTPKGYMRIRLQSNKSGKNWFIHTLVANAFIGSAPSKKHQVNHKDGNKLNNSVDNLEYVTPSQNLIHAYRTELRDSMAKYVVYCKELDILAIGTHSMATKVRDAGYPHVSSSGIWRCINSENVDSVHYDLHFESYTINEFRNIHSPMKHMNLFDVIEMICDWKASSERHGDGNIDKSLRINKKRFLMDDDTVRFFQNTINYMRDRGMF